MDLTVDPHGRIALPAPLNDRFAGQRVTLTWTDNPDGSVDVHLGRPEGLFGPSVPEATVPADVLAQALSEVIERPDLVFSLDPATVLPGAAGRMASRRGALTVTPTFAAHLGALTDSTAVRAVIDVAHAVTAEPVHPSLDVHATAYPNVWAVTAAGTIIAFTRNQDRVPIWLSITRS
jgi:hypothetical protein